MYYDEELRKNVKRQCLWYGLLTAAVFGTSIAGACVSAARQEGWLIPSIIVAVGMLVTAFLFQELFLQTVYYLRFITQILYGRGTELTAQVYAIGRKPVYRDNRLYYYPIMFEGEDGNRFNLYWDESRGFPDLRNGITYTVQAHEKYITDATKGAPTAMTGTAQRN